MKIALFFSGNYIRRYEIEELTNLLKTKNKFLFFYYKKKKTIERSKINIFFDFFSTHGFFSLVLLEQKFAAIIGHKNSFYKKIEKILKKIELNSFVKNYDKYEKFNFKTKKK